MKTISRVSPLMALLLVAPVGANYAPAPVHSTGEALMKLEREFHERDVIRQVVEEFTAASGQRERPRARYRANKWSNAVEQATDEATPQEAR